MHSNQLLVLLQHSIKSSGSDDDHVGTCLRSFIYICFWRNLVPSSEHYKAQHTLIFSITNKTSAVFHWIGYSDNKNDNKRRTDLRLSKWFIVDVDPALGPFNTAEVGSVADFLVVHTTSIFRIELGRVNEWLCTYRFGFNRITGGRGRKAGTQSGPIRTVYREMRPIMAL